MQLKPKKYAPKTGLCNYLNKQNYSDFSVLTTFLYYKLNLLVFILVLINFEF